ncbi:DUR3 [Symbiodinium microadriaticum]|nr:DUR3 [Symbiodinium microadriaticum]
MDVDEGQRAAIALAEAREIFGGGAPSEANPAGAAVPATTAEPEGNQAKAWSNWGQDQNSRDPKYPRKEHKGGWGGKGSWPSWGQAKRKDPSEEKGEAPPLDPTQYLIQAMTKLTLRHESELALLRQETGYILFIDTAPYSCLDSLKLAATKWQELYVANKVTCSLRLALMLGLIQKLRAKLEELLRDDALLQRYKNCGWISDGANASTPMWHYFEWNPKEKKEFQASTPPLSHSIIMATLDEMEQALPEQGVLLKFKSTKPITDDPQQDVLPFLITVGLRNENAHKVFQGLCRLSGNAVMKVLGGRLRPERGQRQPLAKQVEDAYKGNHLLRVESHANVGEEALFWSGVMSAQPHAAYGSARVGMPLIGNKGSPYLPNSMAWRPFVCTWRNITQQHDAGEYLQHILQLARPQAYRGT